MGCCSIRADKSIEELLIQNAEKSLGFSEIHCDDIDASFKRFSLSTKMVGSQFLAACRDLKLDMTKFGSPNSPLTKFFNQFKISEKQYSQRKLSTLGVLLGEGTPKEKAAVLFNIYDIVKDKKLDTTEIKTLIEEVIEISMVFIPKLALLLAEEGEAKIELVRFCNKLISMIEPMRTFYEIVFESKDQQSGNEISKEEFVMKFELKDVSVLCSAKRIRSFALMEHGRIIDSAMLVKDYLLEASKTKELDINK